jgi:hypothetical protein
VGGGGRERGRERERAEPCLVECFKRKKEYSQTKPREVGRKEGRKSQEKNN